MAEVDTSSYPRPAAPVNALDTVAKLGGLQQQKQQIESGALGIDKQKLDLYNQHFQIMNSELANLANDPNTTKQEVLTRMHRIGDMFNMPKPVRAQMEAEFANAPDSPLGKDGAGNPILSRTLDMVIKRGMDIQQKVNAQYGANGTVADGATATPAKTYLRGGPVPSGAPIAVQAPPTQVEYDTNGKPVFRGSQNPQLPPNSLPVQGGFPGQYQQGGSTAPIVPHVVKTLPITQSQQPVTSPVGPRGGSAGFAPGVAEAAKETGAASGAQLAQERAASANFQRDVFPLAQAIPALQSLGTKGTGPGTETLNHIKSFILSNVPGVTEKNFEGLSDVATYDKAKKYLTDFVNQTGNSGTNDKLAAAFAGNPSVSISNAAAVDVAKSALALRRMKQAAYMEFESKNLPDDQFSKHFAKRINEIDPRAFGVDMMTPEAKAKLKTQLSKNKIEAERFEKSLELAHNLGFITPSK